MPRIKKADLLPWNSTPKAKQKRIVGAGRFRPALEQLEDRELLSINPPAIAFALTHSVENYAGIVREAYQQYLGRQPDAAGLSAWVSAMQSGLSDERLEAGFIGSPEYIALHGGTGPEWVKGMYHDLLGRAPDAAGLVAWDQALQNGVAPAAIAYGFAASGEREGQRVSADYQDFLGRSPSPAEVAGWVNGFLNGVSNEDVVAGFVGSPEYYAGQGKGNDVLWLVQAYEAVLGRVPSLQDVQQIVGLPPGDGQAVTGLPGASVVQFQGQDIYWSAATGAHALSGPIAAEYAATANQRDAIGRPVQTLLGLPTGPEQDVIGVVGARVVPFQGGRVYWSATTGAHAVYGAIGLEYVASANLKDAYGKSVQSLLGLPTGDERDVAGVAGARVVSFQGGSIYWSATTGAQPVYGAIGLEYARLGGPSSALGLPVGAEQGGTPGARVVPFQHGEISWSAATGAQARYWTTTAISNLGGVTALFRMDGNSHVFLTVGGKETDLGPGFQGLYQSHDSAGHLVVYVFGNGHLYQFTLTGEPRWTKIGSPRRDRIAQDQSQNLFFQLGDTLYRATGDLSTNGSTGRVAVDTNVQAVYQARDAAGHPAAYVLKNGLLYLARGSGLQQVAGVSQAQVDSTGDLILLESNGSVVKVNGSSSTTIGQSGIAVGDNALWFLGTTLVDAAGRRTIYSLVNGQLGPVTGPAQTVVNSQSVSFALNAVALGTPNGNDVYALDASGHVWLWLAPGNPMIPLGSPDTYTWTPYGGLRTPDGSVWFIANGKLDRFTNGQLQGTSGTGAGDVLSAVDGSLWFLGQDGRGGYALYHITVRGTSFGQYETTLAIGKQWLHAMEFGAGAVLGLPTGNVQSSGGLTWQTFGNGYVCISPNGADSFLNSTGVRDSAGNTWFLGTPTLENRGNRPIYQLHANGTLSILPGAAAQLSTSGGTLTALTAQGDLSILTPQGLTPLPKNLQGLTSLSDGQFAVQVGSWLTATLSIHYDASGIVTMTYRNVEINTGAFFGNFLSGLQQDLGQLAQVLSPLTQTVVDLPPELGGDKLSVADVLSNVLQLRGDSTDAQKVKDLASLEGKLQILSSLSTDLGTIPLGDFSIQMTAAGAYNPLPDLPSMPGVLTQLLGQLQPLGITLPVLNDPSQFLRLIAGDKTVTVATYTAPEVNVPLGNVSATLVSLPAAIGLSVDGDLSANLSAQGGGVIGITAAGQVNGQLSLSLQGDAGLAVEVALGEAGFDAGGYSIFAGLQFQSQLSVSGSGVSFTPPTTTPTFHTGWVGPNFDIKALIQDLGAAGQRLSDAIASEGQQVSDALSNAAANASDVISKTTQNTPLDPSTWDPSKWFQG